MVLRIDLGLDLKSLELFSERHPVFCFRNLDLVKRSSSGLAVILAMLVPEGRLSHAECRTIDGPALRLGPEMPCATGYSALFRMSLSRFRA